MNYEFKLASHPFLYAMRRTTINKAVPPKTPPKIAPTLALGLLSVDDDPDPEPEPETALKILNIK